MLGARLEYILDGEFEVMKKKMGKKTVTGRKEGAIGSSALALHHPCRLNETCTQ